MSPSDSTTDEAIAELRHRVGEIESHLPRIGTVEHDVIALSGKHSKLLAEFSGIRELIGTVLSPMKHSVATIADSVSTMAGEVASMQKQVNKLFALTTTKKKRRKKAKTQ